MRERCWFIPEQVLKGKLPYIDSETFYGPPNPFLLAVVYYIGGILFAALFLVSLGVAAYAWMGALACALCSIYLLIRAGNRPGSRLPADICRAGLALLDRSFACLERTKCVQRVRLGCIKPNGAIAI